MATLEELEKKIQRLEKSLQVLEDLEAIKKLKAQYAQLCDDKYDSRTMTAKGEPETDSVARDIANLFTEDGVWDGGEKFGVARGRQAIYERFKGAAFRFAVHYFVQPQITIDGNRARARWYLWQAATLQDNTAVWMAGFEDDEYIKIDGQWLQSHMKVTILFLTPYEEGWAKKRLNE